MVGGFSFIKVLNYFVGEKIILIFVVLIINKPMRRTDIIKEIIFENDNLNARQIMNLIVSKYPQVWDDKVAYYAEAGEEKTESWVSNQLCAEISSQLRAWSREGKIILSKENKLTTFTATTSFKNSQEVTQDVVVETIEEDEEYNDDDNCQNCGFNYFMESMIFDDVCKIGKTIDVEKRVYDLSKDNRYGVFKLKVKGWVKVKNRHTFENMMHGYFQKFRLDGNKGLKVSTELFKSNVDLYSMWKNFIMVNYIQNPIMKDEILDYSF